MSHVRGMMDTINVPQSTSQDRSQAIECPQFVRIRIRETISVGDAFQFQIAGNGNAGEVVFQNIFSGDLSDLSKSRSDEYQISTVCICSYLSIELELGAIECGIEHTSWAPAEFIPQWDVGCLWSGKTTTERSKR